MDRAWVSQKKKPPGRDAGRLLVRLPAPADSGSAAISQGCYGTVNASLTPHAQDASAAKFRFFRIFERIFVFFKMGISAIFGRASPRVP